MFYCLLWKVGSLLKPTRFFDVGIIDIVFQKINPEDFKNRMDFLGWYTEKRLAIPKQDNTFLRNEVHH